MEDGGVRERESKEGLTIITWAVMPPYCIFHPKSDDGKRSAHLKRTGYHTAPGNYCRVQSWLMLPTSLWFLIQRRHPGLCVNFFLFLNDRAYFFFYFLYYMGQTQLSYGKNLANSL